MMINTHTEFTFFFSHFSFSLLFLTQQQLPTGLVNLGNTCYLNASVQALRIIPELRINLNKCVMTTLTPLLASLGRRRANRTLCAFFFLFFVHSHC